jgi:hypothetical protein
MKHVSNKSTIIKSTLAFLLLSATLMAGAFIVRSTSAAAKSNGMNKAFARLAGVFQTCEPEAENNEDFTQAEPIQIPGQKCGTARFGDAASYEYTYSGGQKDKIEDFYTFNVPTGQTLRVDVTLTYSNAATDLDLFLFKRTGTLEAPTLTAVIQPSNGSALTERLIYDADAGTYLIGVSAFDGQNNSTSVSYTLTTALNSLQPPPTITRIVSDSASAGTGPFSLTVTGTNFFDQQSTVRWNGQPRTTVFITNTQLVAFLSAADVATPGIFPVNVANPPTLGGLSNAVPFTVTSTDISPEVEPNESSNDATLLLAPGKRNGSVAVGDTATTSVQFPGGASDPIEDLYAVTLTQSSRLDLSLVGANGQANLALYLMKEKAGSTDLDALSNSRLGGSIQRITTTGMLAPGRYLVGVSSISGASAYAIEARLPGNRLLQVMTNSAAPGSTVTVPISFYSEGNENSLNFSLKFDPTLLSNPQVTLGSDAATGTVNVNTGQAAQGRVGVQLALQQGQHFGTGAREVAKVTFAIKANPGVGATVLEFGDDPVVRGMVDATGNAVVGTYAAGNVIITPGLEGDVSPRALGNGSLSVADWAQVGRFVSGLDTPADGSEFQRADCAPKTTLGDGKLTIADWVMAGRYSSGLETPVAAGGASAAIAAVVFDKDFAGGASLIPNEQQQTRTIRIVPATFNRGQENTLIVELNSLGNENAIGFSVNFDNTQLTFVRATLGTDAQGAALNVNTLQIAQGRIGIGLALSSGQTIAAGARQIVTLTFNVPASSSVNSTTVSFSDQPIAREVVDATANVLPTTYSPGVITLQPLINQSPSLTSVTPGTVIAGGNNFTITINGTNFVNGAVARVTVNGVTAERLTNFVNSTQLTATLLAQDIAETDTISVSVQNPQPGGGTSNSLSISVVNPVPAITTISPNSAAQNTQGFLLTVNGTNFVPGATVQWNGVSKQTTFVSSTQLRAQIPASDLTTVGTPSVTVVNPSPGGGASNAVTFTIAAPTGIPRITTINPTTVQTDNPGFTLTVNGSNFAQASVVRINGNSLPTTFVSSTQLTAQVTTADIATAGNANISVFTPPPGGGTSNSVILTITTPPNPVPEIASLSPNPVTAGGQSFTLTVAGSKFVSSSVVRLNNQDRPTQFVSATELRATIPASDIANGGTATITVVSPTPGGGTSNAATLTINFAPPVITLLSPSSSVAGGPAFQLTVTGTNFAPGSVVRWNGADRPTTVNSVTQLTAQIPAADIATAGTATVTVFSPAPGAGLSNAVTFTITEATRPLPRITTINPTSALVGSAAITLTVNGTNFVTDSVVRWNGQARPTTFVNSTQLTAQIPASDLAAAGSAQVSVFTPPAGGGESNAVSFAINLPPNPLPAISSINPTTVGAGTGAFTLIVNGTGFVSTSVVQLNGANRPTTFVSDTRLTAQIAAEDIASAGTVAIHVVSPTPGGGTSNDVSLTIVNAVPVITSLSPSVVARGRSGFTLTVNGTGFVQGAQIAVNGATRLTTFVNNAQLTAQITTAEVANVGSLNIQVINPAPGGGSSNIVALLIRDTNPLPRLTALSPDTVLAGGPGFTLVITGTGFSDESVVRVNGLDRQTSFVSETTLAAQITAADVALGGALSINVFNPAPGGGTSNPLTLNVNNPVPRITNLSPDAAAAGNGPFALLVSGVNFVANSVVRFNGIDVPTTLVTNSQLTAAIPASLIASGGVVPVVVFNPPPAGGTSNAVNFSITNPVPSITSINPTQVIAGSGPLTLTINGSGFVPNSIVRVNNADHPKIFVSANQLIATLSADDVIGGGVLHITVFNMAPGGGTSNDVTLAVNNPVPELTQLAPNSIAVGSADFTLRLNGNGFVPGSVVQWNGQPRPTTFVSSTQLTIQLSAAELASVKSVPVAVVNPAPGGGTSNPLLFRVVSQANPTPLLLGLDPNSVIAGSAGFTLRVDGENFVPNAVVNWNGSPRPTTFINSVELQAQISAADVANQGTVIVTVTNPAPGGGTSNSLNFIVNPPNPVPRLIGLIPTVIAAGGPGFSLTVNGTGFVPGAVVNFNGSPRQTAFFSASQLFAQLSAADVANVGTITITVTNPPPGGGTSNALTLSINAIQNPVPTLTGLSPGSVIAGDPAFTLTANGLNFVPGAVVQFNGSPRPTTFVNQTQLVAQITEDDVANGGTADITVLNPVPGGGVSNTLPFPITALSCQTVCLQSPQYYVNNITRLPSGYVIIGGVNFNNPLQIQSSLTDVRRVLRGGSGPMQQLNQQYVALQISLVANSSVLSGAMNSPIRCYGINFDPALLDNGFLLTRTTLLRDLLAQARLAIIENRSDDMIKLAAVMALMNGTDPTNRCN